VGGSPTRRSSHRVRVRSCRGARRAERGAPLVALLSWRDDPVDPTISALLG
jgi:hypothetical protein